MSAELWKPLTSATTAFEFRRLLQRYALETGSPLDFVPWQGHDFSFRGMSGIADATQSGAAHLLSFLGTDTITALDYLETYYGGRDTFLGGSVPATEHSVMCMAGTSGEAELVHRLITKVHPKGVVSIVGDTWDFWNFLTVIIRDLKEVILNRPSNKLGLSKVVVRPDSGDPVKILCGDDSAPEGSPERKGAVECLWDIFGGTMTPKGYKLLDSHIGLIYGDSISLHRAQRILKLLKRKGFASGNIVFGIGSYTYQYTTRDSFGTAIKATFGVVDNEERIIYKAPKTDSGVKYSARGLLRVEQVDNRFVLHEQQTWEQEAGGEYEDVWKNGKLIRDEAIADIRTRLLSLLPIE